MRKVFTNHITLIIYAIISIIVISCRSQLAYQNTNTSRIDYKSKSPKAIDLGLSVKWADRNIGAESPEDFGDSYSWGEVETKEYYSTKTYKWKNPDNNKLTKYNSDSNRGFIDNKKELDTVDDVARVKIGGKWRMPTKDEFKELVDNCTWIWTNINGVKGYKVISKKNSKSIFLPATGVMIDNHRYKSSRGLQGLYWSSTHAYNTLNHHCAYCLKFLSDDIKIDYRVRTDGLPVRPVSN